MVTGPRNSNPLIFVPPIVFGVLCLVGTIVAAILLKPGIEDRMQKPLPVKNLTLGMEIESIDREIKAKDDQIRSEQQRPDIQKQLSDSRRKLDETLGKKSLPDTSASNFEQEKAANIKRLEDEKVQLAAKKRAVTAQLQADNSKKRTWLELAGDYEILLLLLFVLPLGILAYYLVRLSISGRLPEKNPLSLTDFERKSFLFFATAIVVSAFGFLFFGWILSVKVNIWG